MSWYSVKNLCIVIYVHAYTFNMSEFNFFLIRVKSLANDKILCQSKFEEFEILAHLARCFFYRIENIDGKGDNAGIFFTLYQTANF